MGGTSYQLDNHLGEPPEEQTCDRAELDWIRGGCRCGSYLASCEGEGRTKKKKTPIWSYLFNYLVTVAFTSWVFDTLRVAKFKGFTVYMLFTSTMLKLIDMLSTSKNLNLLRLIPCKLWLQTLTLKKRF